MHVLRRAVAWGIVFLHAPEHAAFLSFAFALARSTAYRSDFGLFARLQYLQSVLLRAWSLWELTQTDLTLTACTAWFPRHRLHYGLDDHTYRQHTSVSLSLVDCTLTLQHSA
ncbi:hypothetical protein ASPBRDRAFT_290547 [Aspergillus brasiliensis CBS 101740]|uniref:Uncharacterized protein n=1 Tax=Aspergillus brasiliensis (strain CBS 101740 / IMI 381727 / IBT 21946) TaxID=767769 RepID=A0A1L9UBC0_ASPBC|nr:hypothetical protein ASPBRDRAFT_290547 [Aspergillus brasiliensis CBS 101740]